MVGSPTDEYNFRLNLLYASACVPGKLLEFDFAVVFPDGQWSFPSSLDQGSLDVAEKVGVESAVGKMVAWHPDAVHSHLFCVKGQTSYR